MKFAFLNDFAKKLVERAVNDSANTVIFLFNFRYFKNSKSVIPRILRQLLLCRNTETTGICVIDKALTMNMLSISCIEKFVV